MKLRLLLLVMVLSGWGAAAAMSEEEKAGIGGPAAGGAAGIGDELIDVTTRFARELAELEKAKIDITQLTRSPDFDPSIFAAEDSIKTVLDKFFAKCRGLKEKTKGLFAQAEANVDMVGLYIQDDLEEKKNLGLNDIVAGVIDTSNYARFNKLPFEELGCFKQFHNDLAQEINVFKNVAFNINSCFDDFTGEIHLKIMHQFCPSDPTGCSKGYFIEHEANLDMVQSMKDCLAIIKGQIKSSLFELQLFYNMQRQRNTISLLQALQYDEENDGILIRGNKSDIEESTKRLERLTEFYTTYSTKYESLMSGKIRDLAIIKELEELSHRVVLVQDWRFDVA